MTRRFFDWNRPFLPNVSQRIVDESYSKTLNLGKYVFVLSGRRAMRTLEAYLQRAVERKIAAGELDPSWIPPTYTTLGATFERLYQPQYPIANDLTRLYAMRQTIEEYFVIGAKKNWEKLMPKAPDNSQARLKLATTFLKLKNEIDSECSSCQAIASNLQDDLPDEAARWNALDALFKSYTKKLSDVGLMELNEARLSALSAPFSDNDRFDGELCEYRVLGAVDLNEMQKAFFKRLGDRVEFWVFAPEDKSDLFDEFGCVCPEKWSSQEIPLRDEQLFQVDKPSDQGQATAYLARELSKVYDANGKWEYQPIAATSLTIGSPNEEVTPFIEQRMNELGYETIVGEGVSIVNNRVYKILSAVSEYIDTRSFDSFSELLRKPDVEAYITANWSSVTIEKSEDEIEAEARALETENDAIGNEDEESSEISGDVTPKRRAGFGANWIRELDDYRSRFLPTRVTDAWFTYKDADNPKRNRYYSNLRQAAKIFNEALGDFLGRDDSGQPFVRSNIPVDETTDLNKLKLTDALREIETTFTETVRISAAQKTRTMKDWASSISKFLCALYSVSPSSRGHVLDRETKNQIDQFFQALNKTLNALNEIPDSLSSVSKGSEALHVVLSDLSSSRIEPAPGSDLVEIQGVLDLLFDDAPNLILTGFNEGKLPTSQSGDLFLPEEMRSKVGFRDANRLFARDAYLTTALTQSRRNFCVVFGKRTLQDDPCTPSRFVFATDPNVIPARVVKFFDGKNDDLKRLQRRQLDGNGVERVFPKQNESQERVNDEELVKGFAVPDLRLRQGRDSDSFKITRDKLEFSSLNVTDFKTFIESPYRFLLKKAFGLSPARDPFTNELDVANFGTIAHDVLRVFGNSDLRDSRDPNAIGGYLSSQLDKHLEKFVGDYTSPYVKVQIEQVRKRLWAFANWQAEWRKSGAEIKYIEKGPNAGWIEFPIGDGEKPMKIIGRIDRIDYNPKLERWFVFDYKTFDDIKKGKDKSKDKAEQLLIQDTANKLALFTQRPDNTVDKKYRTKTPSGTLKWVDLQLPLYRYIFRQILSEVGIAVGNDKISLGYIILPKSGEVEALGAPWNEEELEEAYEKGRLVVRTLRAICQGVDPIAKADKKLNEEFGPMLNRRKKPKYTDDFAPITQSYMTEG